MPLYATDYSKTIIYHFVCKDTTIKNDYVGHTTDFTSRKSKHKLACNTVDNKQHHQKIYQMIRDTGGWVNWEMIPLEEFPCESNVQARIREQYWMNQLNPTMNCIKAYQTEEEKKAESHIYEQKRQHKINTDEIYRERRRANKREYNLKTRDKQNAARNLKYKTDGLYRHRRFEAVHARYIKKKEEISLKQKEIYKQQKDELNKLRRNKTKEEKDKFAYYTRWHAWKKKPYESVLNQSFIQKLLK
jgi:hypothetical protein